MDCEITKKRKIMEEDEDYEDYENSLHATCPACNRDYDEIDEEFQICHRCGYNNN